MCGFDLEVPLQMGHTWTHPNKPKDWTVKQYFGKYHATRQDRWVFGDRRSGAYLPKLAWTKIVRHQAVQDRASPDDPAPADYWARRRRRTRPPLDRSTLRLLQRGHREGEEPPDGSLTAAGAAGR